jgi:hypothetical protein
MEEERKEVNTNYGHICSIPAMWHTATPGTFDISSNFSIRIPNEAIAPIPSLCVVSPAF